MLIVAAALAALIMAVGIVDILRLGRERFNAVNKRRWHWIGLILYSGPLGVLLYVAAVRPQVLHPERYTDVVADVLAPSSTGPSSTGPSSTGASKHSPCKHNPSKHISNSRGAAIGGQAG